MQQYWKTAHLRNTAVIWNTAVFWDTAKVVWIIAQSDRTIDQIELPKTSVTS